MSPFPGPPVVVGKSPVLSQEERDLGVAMVDLGGGTTDLAIFLDGSIRHSAVLPIGGQNLTKDLAIGLLTSQTEAEKIKLHRGIARTGLVQGHETVEVPSVGDRPARTFSRRDVAEILEPRVEEIFELVRREIARAGYEGWLCVDEESSATLDEGFRRSREWLDAHGF